MTATATRIGIRGERVGLPLKQQAHLRMIHRRRRVWCQI